MDSFFLGRGANPAVVRVALELRGLDVKGGFELTLPFSNSLERGTVEKDLCSLHLGHFVSASVARNGAPQTSHLICIFSCAFTFADNSAPNVPPLSHRQVMRHTKHYPSMDFKYIIITVRKLPAITADKRVGSAFLSNGCLGTMSAQNQG